MNRSNNFDALRLLGASIVILGHAYHLLGRPTENPGMLGYGIQTLGVVVFFSISGFLITMSWTRTRDLSTYLSARILRIFPALAVVTLISVFVLGPLVTSVSLSDYVGSDLTWGYLYNIIMSPRYVLEGVFGDVPYPGAVNGSLWTLPAEFFCYLVVPVLCLRSTALRGIGMTAFLVISLVLSRVPADESAVIYGTRVTDAALMWSFFAAGSLLCQLWERKPDIFRADLAAMAFLGQLFVLAVAPTWAAWVAWLTIPYVILTVGMASTPFVRRAARFGDISYGLYLWAFPVQQVVVMVAGPLRMSVNLLIVTTITAVLAFASWHLVEKQSMRLKQVISRRRQGSGRRARVPQADARVG